MVKDGKVCFPKGTILRVSLYIPDAPWETQELEWADNSLHEYTEDRLLAWVERSMALIPIVMKRGLDMHYPGMPGDSPPDHAAQKAEEQRIVCEGHRPPLRGLFVCPIGG